ncbi:MAG: nucleoside deaminase [Pirellulales bacterium]|nr:nucleoside deaminase [Pirellulales bacterium]
MIDPALLMRMAIEKCREGIASGQSPFGCAIWHAGRVLAVEHNRVWETCDVTAHAEIVGLRSACRAQGNFLLPGGMAATTCEPCPMCMAALHWARLDTVYYGASIADAAAAGFNELRVPAAELLRLGGSTVKLIPGLLADECRGLFQLWRSTGRCEAY